MRKPSFINKKKTAPESSFNKIVGVIKVIRIELLITFTALIISVGQYFQNSINARISITTTWRRGYTAETRDRVTRFITVYKQAKEDKSDNRCQNLGDSVDKIVSTKKLYDEENKISNDCFIKKLVGNEIEAIKRKERIEKNRGRQIIQPFAGQPQIIQILIKPLIEINQKLYDRETSNDEYIEIVLKYKNALIECLNTLEAVKAVIQSKPLPFRLTIFYKDTLEGRYKDIIEELRDGLIDFIDAYRRDHADRETEAWYVLTSDESYLNDSVNVILYFLIFIAILVLVYFIKTRMQELGLLQESKK